MSFNPNNIKNVNRDLESYLNSSPYINSNQMGLYMNVKNKLDSNTPMSKKEKKLAVAKMQNIVGKKKGLGSSKQSKWINHVKKVQKEKGITYGQALKVASKSYKK